jgi:AraC-like DNA-binding protein
MLLFLNNQLMMPGNLIPEAYRDYLLPGMRVCSWASQESAFILQEIRVGQIKLQYLFTQSVDASDTELLLKEEDTTFILSLEGCWTYCFAPGMEFILPEGHCNLLGRKTIRIRPTGRTGSINRLLCLRITQRQLAIILQVTDINNSVTTALTGTGMQLFKLPVRATAAMLESALQLTQTSYLPHPRQFHRTLANQLLLDISRMQVGSVAGSDAFDQEQAAALHAARQYILSNLQKKFSLDELVRHCGINREQLRVGFMLMYEMSPYVFLRRERMELAKRLLKDTSQRIKQIARSSGYRQLSNFSTAFRRYTGMSPAMFRNRMRNKLPRA